MPKRMSRDINIRPTVGKAESGFEVTRAKEAFLDERIIIGDEENSTFEIPGLALGGSKISIRKDFPLSLFGTGSDIIKWSLQLLLFAIPRMFTGPERHNLLHKSKGETTAQEERKTSFGEPSKKPVTKDNRKSQRVDQTSPPGQDENYDADNRTEIGNKSEPAGGFDFRESKISIVNNWSVSSRATVSDEDTTAQQEERKTTSLDEGTEKPAMKDGQKSQRADPTSHPGQDENYDADNRTEIGNKSEPAGGLYFRESNITINYYCPVPLLAADSEGETTAQEERKTSFGEPSKKPVTKDNRKSQRVDQTSLPGYNKNFDADERAGSGDKSEPHSEPTGGLDFRESKISIVNNWLVSSRGTVSDMSTEAVFVSRGHIVNLNAAGLRLGVVSERHNREETTAQPEKRKKKFLDEASEKPLMADGQKSQQADQTPPPGYNEKSDADDKTEIGNESERHPELAGGQAQSHSSANTQPTQSTTEYQSRSISLNNCVYYYPNERLSEESRVYKGRQRYIDAEFDRERALKVIPAAENNRYTREVENMMHVTGHRNVVQFFQCGRTEMGDFYIVLDLCRKKTLGDIVLEKITPDERKKIFVQICQGVEHLHGRKVAHGDLKPSHILFSLDGKNAVIAGFGHSRKIEEEEDPASYFKKDIFRLGCLGVYVLTLFAEGHTASYRGANSHEMSTPKLDGLGPLEKDLFKRMLSHDPKERPSIDKVLQHCMFWSHKKVLNFLRDINSYSGLLKPLSEPLLVIDRYFKRFQEVPLQNVEKNQLLISSHLQQLADEAGISGYWLKTMIRIESKFETCETEELRKVEQLFGRKVTLNENLNKLLDGWESEQSREQKEALYKQMKDWRDETESIIRKRERRRSMIRCLEDSSLKGLLEYLRSYSDKVEKLLEAFPKLVPFLIRNMGKDLEDEDKEEYLHATPQVKNLCLT